MERGLVVREFEWVASASTEATGLMRVGAKLGLNNYQGSAH